MIGLSSCSNKSEIERGCVRILSGCLFLPLDFRYTMLKGTVASASVVVSSDVAYILELRHSLNLRGFSL